MPRDINCSVEVRYSRGVKLRRFQQKLEHAKRASERCLPSGFKFSPTPPRSFFSCRFVRLPLLVHILLRVLLRPSSAQTRRYRSPTRRLHSRLIRMCLTRVCPVCLADRECARKKRFHFIFN